MATARRPIIGLLTDFGTRDWYAAAMKAVILTRCPNAQLIDITHEVPAHDVVAGAFQLAAAVPWFPRGAVVVGVVDPGVGSSRDLLAAEVAGRYLLGPDNGLLAPSIARSARARLVRLTRSRDWLPTISRTFHGRDILAPVAARLARGAALSRVGRPTSRFKPLPLPAVVQRGSRRWGQVIHVDGFGNLVTNLKAERPGGLDMRIRYDNHPVRMVSCYAEGRAGELIAVEGSLGLVELVVRNASAARRVGGERGDRVTAQLAQAGTVRQRMRQA